MIGALSIVHAPLIVNNGLFGEDWLLFQTKPGYPTQTDFLIHGAGHPLLYAYCTLANLSGYPLVCMQALALAGIAIGAVSLKNLLVRLDLFSGVEAAMFSFLVWTYAGYQDWATKLTATYIFSFALLCLGLNLLAVVIASDRPRIWLRLCSLAVVFCSFSLNSMIVAYLIGLCVVLLAQKPTGENGRRARLTRSATRFADFLAVPVLYWISVNHFFPKLGPYRDYYLIKIPGIEELVSKLSDFWRWGFYQPIWEALALTKETRWPIAVALIIGLGFVMLIARRGKIDADRQPGPASSIGWLALAAIAVFVICALPYIVSGISPNGHFYESRHLILFGIPLGLLLLGAYRAVWLISGRNSVACVFAGLALSLNLCALWNDYFLQQARWLQQTALIEGLRNSYREPPAAVFNLVDGFSGTRGHTFFGLTEITGALHTAWDGRPLFGFTGRSERPTILQEMDAALRMDGSAFHNMDIWGPQATIELVPRPPVLTNYELSLKYYRCLARLCDTQSLTGTLADTTVRMGPIAGLTPRGS